jgi:Nop14-like family
LAGAAESGDEAPQLLSFWQVASMDLQSGTAVSSKQSRKALKAQCIHTCLDLINLQMRLIEKHACASLEACMCPTRNALAEFIQNAAASSLLKRRAKRLLRDTEGAVQRSIQARVAPVCADVVKKNPKKLLNPKFEIEFDKRKDYDPDRERAEYKQYKRMAAKEKRGALSPPSASMFLQCALTP